MPLVNDAPHGGELLGFQDGVWFFGNRLVGVGGHIDVYVGTLGNEKVVVVFRGRDLASEPLLPSADETGRTRLLRQKATFSKELYDVTVSSISAVVDGVFTSKDNCQ
jgi:hypothetical protein